MLLPLLSTMPGRAEDSLDCPPNVPPPVGRAHAPKPGSGDGRGPFRLPDRPLASDFEFQTRFLPPPGCFDAESSFDPPQAARLPENGFEVAA